MTDTHDPSDRSIPGFPEGYTVPVYERVEDAPPGCRMFIVDRRPADLERDRLRAEWLADLDMIPPSRFSQPPQRQQTRPSLVARLRAHLAAWQRSRTDGAL
jgi:hypothetical protein